jgi:hypothetical protein
VLVLVLVLVAPRLLVLLWVVVDVLLTESVSVTDAVLVEEWVTVPKLNEWVPVAVFVSVSELLCV